ncbi:MAG: hypothetical protein HYV63_00975 [Candidatus Schekmanbacteria bacterium]|nr:hypothetical protein [Candidatus Schekmanbacteria bacterium]
MAVFGFGAWLVLEELGQGVQPAAQQRIDDEGILLRRSTLSEQAGDGDRGQGFDAHEKRQGFARRNRTTRLAREIDSGSLWVSGSLSKLVRGVGGMLWRCPPTGTLND